MLQHLHFIYLSSRTMYAQKMKLISRIVVFAGMLPWAISCANNDLGPVIVVDCDGFKTVSYKGDIKPIVDKVCSKCHNSSFVGRNWTDPAQLKAFATEAARRVVLAPTEADHMPKDPPELEYAQIENIVCWAKQGAPIDN